MVSGTLALLKYSVIYMNVKQGSGPDRGQSPVEWGEIPSVRPSGEAQARCWEALARSWEAKSRPWEVQARPWEARARP